MALKDSFKFFSEKEIRQRVRQRRLAIERNRKKREVYEIKKISGWMLIGSSIVLIVVGIGWLMDSENLFYMAGLPMAMFLYFFIDIINSKWEASVAVKKEIEIEEKRNKSYEDYDDCSLVSSDFQKLNGFEYQHDYIYTDSFLSYCFYGAMKFIMGITSIVLYLGVIILVFILLASVEIPKIAPTTGIIFLLSGILTVLFMILQKMK